MNLSNTIEYKGYLGSVEFSAADGIFFGKVLGLKSLISYEGEDAHSLLEDFHQAVDDYLRTCEAEGMIPEKSFKGSFNVRISPELHKRVVMAATSRQISLNRFVEDSLERAVQSQ